MEPNPNHGVTRGTAMKRFMCHLLAIPVWVAVCVTVSAIIPKASHNQRFGVTVTVIVGYYLAGVVRDFFVEILGGGK